MKSIHITLFLIVAALSIHSAKADDLKFCYEPWEPFHFLQDGKSTGIQIELLSEITAQLGHTAVFAELPYPRCLKEVALGNFDAILLTSGEEELLIPTTVSTAYWEIGIITRPNWPKDSFLTLNDFDGKKAGLAASYDYGAAINAARKNWKVEEADEPMTNLRKTAAGRLDFTIADIMWAQMLATRNQLKLKFLTPALQSQPQFTFFNKNKTEYIKPISTKMQLLLDNGTVDRLYEKYTGHSFTEIQQRNAKSLLK